MKSWTKITLGLATGAALAGACKKGGIFDEFISETKDAPTSAQVQGYVFRPATVPATDDRVRNLKVPAGFTVVKFAENMGKPRMLHVSGANVYVTDRDAGTVTLLRDTNGDGKSDVKQVVANLKQVHGLAERDGKLYLVTVREVYTAAQAADGTLAAPQLLVGNLPDGGQHPNRTMAFGPDGRLYITVGSTCNACVEPNPENATIVTVNPDGSNKRIFAKGLRNTIGFGWHPQTGELWGLDHGIDWLGDEEQKEELNRITQGAHYGWPHIYADGKYNPQPPPPGDTTYAQFLAKTTLPTLLHQAHSAPLGMVFYTGGNFPAEYKNDAFVTLRGSWNRSTPSGYSVVRLRFENGKPTRFEDFMTGFLVDNNRAQFGRPVGIAQTADGALLVTDDTNGVIYRIAYGNP